MSQTLPPITLANALAAYKNADANGKKLLENLHGKKPFTECMSIMERVSNFNDICEIAGANPNDYILSRDARNWEISNMAYEKIKLIVKTLNEGWKPNWANRSECKYYPYFLYNRGCFSYQDYASNTECPIVDSRLVFKSKTLTEFAGKLFVDIYADYML